MAALVRFDRAGGRRITFEYTMIRGINDDSRLASGLADLASSVDAFVNLIPYNPIPYQDWRASRGERIEEFRSVLEARGVSVAVRVPRGRDIEAACGQLRANRREADSRRMPDAGGRIEAASAYAGKDPTETDLTKPGKRPE